jgi:trehalose-6-phosphatase
MAHSSSSKKREKEDTDSDSKDEVNRDPDSMHAEITRLNGLNFKAHNFAVEWHC